MIDEFDYECEGQTELEDYLDGLNKTPMIAVSKVFARAKKEMNLPEWKAFIFALSQIKWSGKCPETIDLDKELLAKALGINADKGHLSGELYKALQNLPMHSGIKIKNEDEGYYASGVLITDIASYRGRFRIRLNSNYLPMFGELEKDFITLWGEDLYQLSSERSIEFYEHLRLNSDTRITNSKGFGIRAFKELFNIPREGEGSYVRADGSFDRPAFEKYVIDPLCKDLKKCKMINLVLQPNGRYYEKIKRGSRVLGYKFEWTVSDRPAVAAADEVKQISEAVAKNPQIMKVAKDIVNGKTKQKPKSKNQFSQFPQRELSADYYAELERKKLGLPETERRTT